MSGSISRRNSRDGQMSIGMNILGFGAHSGAWRSAEVPANAYLDVEYYRHIARISERGCLDAIFLADGPALAGDVARQLAGRLEPTVLLTAVALATQRIGVIATASSTHNDPFNIARRFASLDHISGGRAAWNVVTNAGDAAAQNFGLTGAPLHVDRYARADKFIDVAVKLWDSWEDGAMAQSCVTANWATAISKSALFSHREGVGPLAYSPLAFGALTGKYLNGARPEGSRLSAVYRAFNRYGSASAQEAISGYVQIAQQHGLTPAQLALAYIIDKPFVASALTGQTTLVQLRENLGALDVELTEEIKAQVQAVHQSVPNPAP